MSIESINSLINNNTLLLSLSKSLSLSPIIIILFTIIIGFILIYIITAILNTIIPSKLSSINYNYDPLPEPSFTMVYEMLHSNNNKSTESESKESIDTDNDNTYDIVIAGGGSGGLLQVLHLLLKQAEILNYCNQRDNQDYSNHKIFKKLKIVIIDPLSSDRREDEIRALKIGESTVFPSAHFLSNELGLHDYLIENHPPKHGLFYHWPKNISKTDNWNDFYSCLGRAYPELPSFQLNRAKFERDLLKMCIEKGVKYIRGAVKSVIVNNNNQDKKKLHSITYTIISDENTNTTATTTTTGNKEFTIYGSHLIDAAGRRFLLSTNQKTLIKDPNQLFDVNNASVWVRARNCNYSLYSNNNSMKQSISSWHYATNHHMGNGYWLWVIPIETNNGQDISIGVSYHHQIYEDEDFNSVDKFLAFLKANQTILYNTITSGNIIDFHFLPRLAHLSSTMLSINNWYIIGDASYNADPFYSTGLVQISFQVQSVSAAILISNSNHYNSNSIISKYNTAMVEYARRNIFTIHQHHKHLGNASIMSWRIFIEVILFSGTAPNWISKWFLCPEFAATAEKSTKDSIWLYSGFYDILSDLADKSINIGLADYNEPYMLPSLNKSLLLHTVLESPDHPLSHAKYGFKRTNIFSHLLISNKLLLESLIIIIYRGYGILGYFNNKVFSRIIYLLYSIIKLYFLKRSYNLYLINNNIPENLAFHQRKLEFKTYIPENIKSNKAFVKWINNKEK